jgi:DNA repair protein RadC
MKIQNNIAEVTIGYSSNVAPSERPSIQRSSDAEDILRPFFQPFIEHHEAFYILLLNRANKVLGVSKISEGGLSGTVVDIRIIFQAAILSQAQSVIMAHNHPSGTNRPSEQDKNLTKKIKKAGEYMDINILDHLILTTESFYSFADEGLL